MGNVYHLSAECKTVIIVVLTVISGMNPHMISEAWDGFWLSLGWIVLKWVLLGYGSVTVRLHDAIEIVIRGDEIVIYLLEYLMHRVNHHFLQDKPESSCPL
jgi:hypothetical protein